MTKKKGFDLGSLDTVAACSEPTEFELEHPKTKEGVGIFIKLLGPDSKEAQEIEHRLQTASFERSLKRKKITEKDIAEAFSEGTEKNIQRLVASTVGWRDASIEDGVVLLEGKEVKFSKDAARKLYERFPWIREQMLEYLRDRGNFIKG